MRAERGSGIQIKSRRGKRPRELCRNTDKEPLSSGEKIATVVPRPVAAGSSFDYLFSKGQDPNGKVILFG